MDLDFILGNKKSSKVTMPLNKSSKAIHQPDIFNLFLGSKNVQHAKSSDVLGLFGKSSKSDPMSGLISGKTPVSKSSYILNDKSSKSAGLGLFGKSSRITVQPNPNSIMNNRYINTSMPDGSILTDKKTKQQKSFLRKTRIGTGKSHLRFIDLDGDGVIGGLDCEPFNSGKHGFFGNVKAGVQNYVEQRAIASEEERERKIEEALEDRKKNIDDAIESDTSKKHFWQKSKFDYDIEKLKKDKADYDEHKSKEERFKGQAKKLKEKHKQGLGEFYDRESDKMASKRVESEQMIRQRLVPLERDPREKSTAQEVGEFAVKAAKSLSVAGAKALDSTGKAIGEVAKYTQDRQDARDQREMHMQDRMVELYKKDPKHFPFDKVFGQRRGIDMSLGQRAQSVSDFLGSGRQQNFMSGGSVVSFAWGGGANYGQVPSTEVEGQAVEGHVVTSPDGSMTLEQAKMYLTPTELRIADGDVFIDRPHLRANYIFKKARENYKHEHRENQIDKIQWQLKQRELNTRLNAWPLEHAQMEQQRKYALYQQKLSDVNKLKLDEELENLVNSRVAPMEEDAEGKSSPKRNKWRSYNEFRDRMKKKGAWDAYQKVRRDK